MASAIQTSRAAMSLWRLRLGVNGRVFLWEVWLATMGWIRQQNPFAVAQSAPHQNVTHTHVLPWPHGIPSPTVIVIRAIADDFVSSTIASLNHCSRLSSTIPTTPNSITCMPALPIVLASLNSPSAHDTLNPP